jgi:hypothetical protein
MSQKEKSSINLIGLPPDVAAAQRRKTADQLNTVDRGVAGSKLVEAIPHFNKSDSEKIIEGENNSFIVLGRDRYAGRTSGYGGKGDTQCAAIDIVVGRMSPMPIQETPASDRVYTDPLFTTKDISKEFKSNKTSQRPNVAMDAARIYISQKTDVDHNFKITAGTVGSAAADENPKSAIALQADGIRIIGRENIKIITHGPGSSAGVYNSQGGLLESVGGIDLIAGNNDEDLQPLVKGDNMVECVKAILKEIDSLNGIVSGLLSTQMKFNSVLTSHIHHSPFLGLPTSPSPTCIPEGASAATRHLSKSIKSIKAQKKNLSGVESKFCVEQGKVYILSDFNNTN